MCVFVLLVGKLQDDWLVMPALAASWCVKGCRQQHHHRPFANLYVLQHSVDHVRGIHNCVCLLSES